MDLNLHNTTDVLINSSNFSTTSLTVEQLCIPGSDSSNLVNRIVTQISAAILTFGLGCSAEIQQMWSYIKKIKQFSTAMMLQLFVMPWLGFGLSLAFQMTQAEITGVIIQASCPGGIYSNIISYYLDGNIHLSIVMTGVSTIVALGTIPLWLYVFPLIVQIENNCLVVPFDALGYALLGIIVPLSLGMIVKYRFPKRSELLTKICTAVGSLATMIYAVVAAFTGDNDFLNNISWKIIVVSFLQLTIGFVMGYLATRVPWFSFSVPARRTVAIETALQNGALATTIVLVSFDSTFPTFGSIFLYPLLYSGLQLFIGFFTVVIYLILKRKNKCLSLIPYEDEEISYPARQTQKGINNPALTITDINFNMENNTAIL